MSSMREEIIWAAGFFDGEGHTSVNLTKAGYAHIGISIDNCDLAVLKRFRKAMLCLGKINGPYSSRSQSGPGRDRYRFTSSNWETCQAIIAMMGPFLSGAKREQCVKALEMADPPSRPWGR